MCPVEKLSRMPASTCFFPFTICILHRDMYNRTCYILTLKNFQAPSLRSPLVGPLRFNQFLVPSLLHSQPSNFALRITVIFHPINIRQHRIQPKINDPRLCFASSFFLISSETITDRPIVDTSRFRLDSSRTSFVEIVKVSRDTMNYSCRGDAKLRETFLRRGVPVCACFTLRAFRPSESVCACVCVRTRVLVS